MCIRDRIDLGAIQPPAVFSWLAQTGGVAAEEMLRTFNCGVGMIVVAAQDNVDEVQSALEAQGESVIRLGKLAKRADNGPGVTYQGTLAL